VTPARSAGLAPAAPANIPSRGATFAAAGVLAAINAQGDQIVRALTYLPLIDAILGVAGISVLIWAAMISAWKIGSEDRTPLSGWRDAAVLSAILLLSFVPVSYAAKAALLLCTGYLLVTAGPADAQRRTALVLLALTGPLIWGGIFLHSFERPILALDAHIVGAAIGSSVDGNVVHFAGRSDQFLIGGPCSSVHNISLGILLWTTTAMLFRIRIDRGYLLIGIAMIALMFGLNIIRLSVIGFFPSHFDFLHVGGGAELFAWAGLLGAGLLAGMGALRANPQQL
jgi:hypothetical protein